ncbi:MAG: energy transducer TonB [Nitrospirota bacterium]|nr:energy transducer TonB [Nitrospirota bacterium]
MNTCTLSGHKENLHYAKGLAVSVLLHAMAVSVAVVFIADLQLVPQPNLFKWDVAMVEAPTQPRDNPTQTPTQPTSAPPPSPASRRIQKTIEKQPIVHTVQPVQQVVHQEVVHTRPLAQTAMETIHHPTVEIPQTINRTAQAIETLTPDLPSQPTSAPVTDMTPIERDTAVLSTPHEVATVTKQMSPAVQERVVNETSPTITESTAVVERASAVEAPAAAPSSMREHSVRSAPSMQASTSKTESFIEQAKIPGSPVVEFSPTKSLPSQSRPAVKADFGWLARALLSRIEQLKRYPQTARADHLEGRVVLRAVIRDDGELIRVDVAESSGYSALDDDALDIIRKASPLELAHPLGQQQVIVRVPIRYRLEQ